jgi:hypothetical protein
MIYSLIFISSRAGMTEIKNTDILPRIGDKVDMFYMPLPKVVDVILYPSLETTKQLVFKEEVDLVDAIIMVE